MDETTDFADESADDPAGETVETTGEELFDIDEALDDALEDAQDLTPKEEAALRRVRGLSFLLDDALKVPGTDFRIGLDPILSVLPVAGDAVAAVLSLYPVLEAYRLDVPRETLTKMLALVVVDAVGGSVPVLGTLFDAFWKANEWNVKTIERHLE